MIAFEIHINGKKRFTAGGDYQALTTALIRIRTAPGEHSLLFDTSGIEPEPFSMAHWPDCEVRIGDRIEIRVVETGSADPPARVDTQQGDGEEVG